MFVFGFLISAQPGMAQNKKALKTIMEKMGLPAAQAGSTITSPAYEQAKELAGKAFSSLKAGNILEAEILIQQSLEAYPTVEIFEFAQAQALLPDVKAANLLMDKAIERVKAYPGDELLVLSPVATTFRDGKMVAEVNKYSKPRAWFIFSQKTLEVNKVVAERKWILKSLEEVVLPEFPEDNKSKFVYDYEFNMQRGLRIEWAIMRGEYEKAFEIIEGMSQGPFFSEEVKNSYKLGVYMAKRDFTKAFEIAETLKQKPAYKDAYHAWMFNISAISGDAEKAIAHYNSLGGPTKENTNAYYNLGLVDLARKDYHGAVKNFNTSVRMRGSKGLEVYLLTPGWELYTGLGNAYAGLKDYGKARDNYNIALLYYPEYQPAIDGLTELEVNYVTETATDKTPPLISITQPATARGLKVTSASEQVMVRGFAKDPSGIKEVSLNGKVIYSQQGGDFWGEVSLAAGANKIEVVALDMAGNKAVQLVEIERSEAVIAQTDIIPVVATEGKNYALFVAAQNYTDSAIPSLENPVADAVKLKLILKNNYNFADANIISLFNPVSNDLRRQLLELTNILQPEDKLVIFYAGHGIWVDKEKKGYWLLTDAKRSDSNTWLPNRDVLDLIAKIPARHTLLITDACFSGSVFKTRGLGEGAPAALQEMDNKISRIAITSGNDTEVPDESVFMKYLVKALSENKDKYLTAQKMFINQIIEAVMTESKTEPRYGTLELAGHVGGDFIFTKK